jgi:hypothetical protein
MCFSNVKLSSRGFSPRCAVLSSHSVFRRLQAVVVVLALLIAPLALYARGADDAMRDCKGMCCLPHAHAMAMAMQTAKRAAEPQQLAESAVAEPECHHEAAAKTTAPAQTAAAKARAANPSATPHSASASNVAELQCALDCAAHRAPHSGNFGLLVPIAPTKPSHIATIRTSIDTERFAHSASQVTASGFVGSPFQPPRA